MERVGHWRVSRCSCSACDACGELVVLNILIQQHKHTVRRFDALQRAMKPPASVFATQELMYRALEDEAKKRPPKHAVLLQYSCRTALPLARALASLDCQVELFIQDPATAARIGSSLQADRIRTRIVELPLEMGQFRKNCSTPLAFGTIASVSAVKLDESVIGIGWYWYRQAGEDEPLWKRDRIEVVAHDVPAVLARSGSPEFEAIKKFFDRVHSDCKTHAKPADASLATL